MKKRLTTIITCFIIITYLTCLGAVCQDFSDDSGYVIAFNGDATEYISVIRNDIHYVPMSETFEAMGAAVFYRSRDCQFLALTRNGDIVRHVAGDNVLTVNGESLAFANPSVLNDNETYIPLDMLSAVFFPDSITFDDLQLNIQKQTVYNDYHTIVKDVLDVCRNSNFYPERFQRYINYHVNMPYYSIEDVVFRVNLGLDNTFYEDVVTIEHPNELLVLVNKYNKLPTDFQQYNLVNMEKKHTLNDGKVYLLEAGAYEKYVQMSEAAKKEGLSMRVVSAHRTEAYQANLYNKRLKSQGKTRADAYTARTGFSEHQTGLAVDINSTKGTFEYTEEFKWLQKHAHEYGFIMRYPKGKEWITGYGYEPWHYRYVGVDVAKTVYEEGITYEEYCAKYISVNEFAKLEKLSLQAQ